MYELKFKAWLELGGRFVLSGGKAELLRAVRDGKSLRAACTAQKISYRHAWGMLKKISDAVGAPVVQSVRGGREKGTTVLTVAGEEALHSYDFGLRKLQRASGPALTVDGILVRDNKLLLVRRGRPPFEGRYALPGGFVEPGETVEKAVSREILEETGLRTKIVRMVGVYSDPVRDPRLHTASVVYELALTGGKLKGGDDAAEAVFVPLDKLPKLAFDHSKVVRDFLAMG